MFFIPGLNLIDSLYLCSVNKIFQKLLLYKRFWTTVTAIQLAILIRNIANIDFFSICYVAALHQTLGVLLKVQHHSPDANHCDFTIFDPKVTGDFLKKLGP